LVQTIWLGGNRAIPAGLPLPHTTLGGPADGGADPGPAAPGLPLLLLPPLSLPSSMMLLRDLSICRQSREFDSFLSGRFCLRARCGRF
jgi:hypothetical protein